jgi:hypothetical protein
MLNISKYKGLAAIKTVIIASDILVTWLFVHFILIEIVVPEIVGVMI